MENIITVFTSIYNRGNLLDNLYQSLKRQTDRRFEWLIVDDGSEDNTRETVRDFIKEGGITIRYYYQENQGKHMAVNLGAKEAKGEWFFIVDSDDYLVDTAIEELWKYLAEIAEDSRFAGVAGLKGKPDGSAWLSWYGKDQKGNEKLTDGEKDYLDATSIEYRYKYKVKGDRAEVIRTELIRKYPFPKFGDERFLSEAALWFPVAEDGYKFRWFPSVIYIAEYLEDGLSRNSRELHKKNWRGSCYVENQFLTLHGIPFLEKVKSGINYYRYGFYGGKTLSELFGECRNKWLGSVCWFAALLLRIK